jgi:hypothetical protein
MLTFSLGPIGAQAAFAATEFDTAVRTACTEASTLDRGGLLDRASAAYAALERVAPTARCNKRTLGQLLRSLSARQRERSVAFERARALRLARRFKPAYTQYLRGLRMDPASEGPRFGLRALLLGLQPRSAAAHCRRAAELLDARLLREARTEHARALRTDTVDRCPQTLATLLKQRDKVSGHIVAGRRSDRNGEGGAARREYLAALLVDPGSGVARTALDGTRGPLSAIGQLPRADARLTVGGAACARGTPLPSRRPRSFPVLTSVVTLRVGPHDPDLMRMRRHPEGGKKFAAGRNRLLRRLGLPDVQRPLNTGFNTQDQKATVDVASEAGRARVTVRVRGLVVGRVEQFLWPWIIEPKGGGLTLRYAATGGLPGTRQRVVVDACGWRLADPSPVAQTQRTATKGKERIVAWEAGATGFGGHRPAVTIDLPTAARLALSTAAGWRWLRTTLALLIPAVLALLALVFSHGLSDAASNRAAATSLLAALAVLAVARTILPADPTDAQLAAIGLIPLVAITLVYAAAVRPAQTGRLVTAVAFVLAAATLAWAPLTKPGDAPLLLAALSLGVVFMTSWALLAAAIHSLARGLGRPHDGWRWRWRGLSYATLFAIAATQTVQFAFQLRSTLFTQGVYFSALANDDQPWIPRVIRTIPYLPVNALSISSLLLVIAAGVALEALGRSSGQGVRRPVFSPPKRTGVLVVALFAGVVTGGSAPLLGLSVPVAVLLGALYLWRVRSGAVREADASTAHHLAARRTQLLDRAAAIQRERRLQDNARTKYATADESAIADEDALATRLRASDQRLEAARRGGAGRPPALPLPDATPPDRIALGLGPSGQWWPNGLTAVKLAWPLALVPIAFSLYLLIAGIVDRAPASILTQVALGVAASVAVETTFWLVAAFSLGALLAYLPSNIAPLKATALTGAYVLPLAALDAVSSIVDALTGIGRPFDIERSTWTFRGFQLLLFLVALGVRIDGLSVRRSIAHLMPLYGLDTVRSAVVYVAPVIVTVLLVANQLFRGQQVDALQTVLQNASSFLPVGPGR